MPAHALHDPESTMRMAEWLRHCVANMNRRVLVTPQRRESLDDMPLLRALSQGIARRRVCRLTDWEWGSGPVVLVWPDDRWLERAVPMAVHQTLIVLERAGCVDFRGWATAARAYNPSTGRTMSPLCDPLRRQFVRLLSYDFELAGSAVRGGDRERPQRHLRELIEAGLDENFVVTYALALDRKVPASQIREHYRAAAAGRS
jgi:hypothetical protein